MRIKKFNEEFDLFKKKDPLYTGKTWVGDITDELGLPCEEKEIITKYHQVDKDGWCISIKNSGPGNNGVKATVDTAYNGLYVDKDIKVEDLEDFLSSFDFSPKDGKRPLAVGGHGAEHHVNAPRVPLWPGDRGHDLP
jgi:hypothetical protein